MELIYNLQKGKTKPSKQDYFDLGNVHGVTVVRLGYLSYPRGRGGYSPNLWVRVCHTVLKTLTLFQTKIYYFSDPFSDLEAV